MESCSTYTVSVKVAKVLVWLVCVYVFVFLMYIGVLLWAAPRIVYSVPHFPKSYSPNRDFAIFESNSDDCCGVVVYVA